jgi:NAD-dependent dihydropyrimidine dehydrogenase PreA subunit
MVLEKHMKAVRKIVEIDEERCDGCGQCVIACAEGAIEIVDGKAKLIKDIYCDGLGACLGECPQGALRVIEREAAEFDPEAVEHHLERMKRQGEASEAAPVSQCPSSQVRLFEVSSEAGMKPDAQGPSTSALTHWPVQIRLVPAKAPFLKGADLLVAADCTPIAYGNFHRDFLQGKVLLLGCPKLDDVQEYLKKFAEIFSTVDIKSVTVLSMEVPCCSALGVIVKKGMAEAGKTIPMEEVVIGVRGDILGRKKLAA